jgi:phage terminase large subunit GpA-like protein
MNSPTTPEASSPEGLQSLWLLDAEVFADAIEPDPDLTIDTWADEHRVLSPESSSEPGPWRTERVPHTREIMQALSPSDPTTEVTFVAGTQVAKTETGNNFIGFVMDVAGGAAMMVYPTSNTGKRSSRTRLAKMIESTPRLRAKVSDKARDKANSATLKEYPGGVLAIAGANSAAELKSMPVRFLFEDEVDEYPDDVDGQGPADALAEKRTDTYRLKKKIFRTSTPTELASSKIWKHWKRSDMRRFHVPCPHCAGDLVLRWEGFRWETRKVWEIVRADDGVVVEVEPGTEGAQARDTGELVAVWYECEHCQGRVVEHHKAAMLPAGRWVPERPDVKHHRGYHLPAFYSPLGWYSWEEAVKSRLEAEKDPTGQLLKLWTNTVAAEPWTDVGESLSDTELKQRALDAAIGNAYRRGMVPLGGLMLTASVDVQGARLEVKVKAWGRDKESWLVDHEVIFGDTETSGPWDGLDEYLQKRFPHESGAELRITATAVDAGYRTQIVYDWCRTRSHRHIFPVRGMPYAGRTILGRPNDQDIDHNGKKIPNGVKSFPIGTDTAKTEIYARLKITKPGPGCMHFPRGLPDEYFKQLTAERLVTKYHRGYLKRVWEKDQTERNEALDLEVYAYAAAIYAGITRINWDRLEAALRMTAGDLFVQAQAKEPARVAEEAPPAPSPDDTPAPVQTSTQPRNDRGWIGRREGWLSGR